MKITKKSPDYRFLITLGVLAVLITSCTAGPNALAGSALPGQEPAGFFQGLWHGMISFITFIVSLFNKEVNIYEVHNAGAIYNLGFILGVMIAYGGGAKGSGGWKRKD